MGEAAGDERRHACLTELCSAVSRSRRRREPVSTCRQDKQGCCRLATGKCRNYSQLIAISSGRRSRDSLVEDPNTWYTGVLMKSFASNLAVGLLLVMPQAFAAQPRPGLLRADSHSSASEPDDSDEDEAPAPSDKKNEPLGGECHKSNAPLTLSIDRKLVSLEEGRVQAKMDGPICSLTMQIIRKDGTVTDKSFQYAGPEQELRWTPVPRDQIEKVEFRITAKDHAYKAVWLIPWQVKIEHKEVRFDTNKSVIRDSEVPALKDSLSTINEVLHKVEGKGLGTITLFIAGHTDTRGSAEHNMTLSRSRAESIANWFVKEGLCVPIAYEGFGETALKKLTADEVDEPENRRVDYILSVEPPTIKKGAAAAWKMMSKGCK